jgi:hypothetical protein
MPAVNAVTEFIDDWRPDVFILGGDQLNCGPISHWSKGKPRLNESFKLKNECALLNDRIIQEVNARDYIQRAIWMEGNHEVWIRGLVDEHPGIEGMIEPENVLDIEGWEKYSQGEIFKLGKLHFIHGDTIKPGKYVAARAAAMYRRNLRFGHHHKWETATDVTPVDMKDYHTATCVPCMARCGASYMKNAPEIYMQGFLIGEVSRNGNFQDQVVTINNGRFYWNGTRYPKK